MNSLSRSLERHRRRIRIGRAAAAAAHGAFYSSLAACVLFAVLRITGVEAPAVIPTSPTTAGGPGQWAVVSGTGAYANLHGAGSLTMDIDFVSGAAVETMEGSVFFDSGN